MFLARTVIDDDSTISLVYLYRHTDTRHTSTRNSTSYINFQLALEAYRVLNGLAPPYLNQLVSVSSLPGRRRLRSSFTLQLHVPQYRMSAAGRHSFPVAASIF